MKSLLRKPVILKLQDHFYGDSTTDILLAMGYNKEDTVLSVLIHFTPADLTQKGFSQRSN